MSRRKGRAGDSLFITWQPGRCQTIPARHASPLQQMPLFSLPELQRRVVTFALRGVFHRRGAPAPARRNTRFPRCCARLLPAIVDWHAGCIDRECNNELHTLTDRGWNRRGPGNGLDRHGCGPGLRDELWRIRATPLVDLVFPDPWGTSCCLPRLSPSGRDPRPEINHPSTPASKAIRVSSFIGPMGPITPARKLLTPP